MQAPSWSIRLLRILALLTVGLFALSRFGSAASPSASPSGGPVPPPWTDADIGSPGIPGSATFAAGTFTVNASGTDIETNFDQFHYVYQQVAGNVTVVARVDSIQNTDPWAKGGVMIRETLDPNSKHAMMVLTPGNGVAFQRRKTTNGITISTSGSLVAAPWWVAIVRFGNTLIGYSSPDGVAWTEVASDTVPMTSAVYVGLPLTSHNNSLLCTATFDNVSVTPGFCAPGDFLVDGGFEATDPGTLTNPYWAGTSTTFGTPLCGIGLCNSHIGTAGPQTGNFWAWFGGTAGVNPETATLTQAVTIPVGASATLAFSLWISAVTAPFTDTLEIQVDGVTQATFTEPATAELGYTPHTVDLSAFADGQTHAINFLYTQPANGGTSSFNVDDAALTITCGPTVSLFPFSMTADQPLGIGILNNGVFEMNETAAVVAPGWSNNTASGITLTGTASNLTGGVGTTSTIDDSTADYGLIASGSHIDCLSATGNCYGMTLTGDRSLQPVHFDVTFDETVTPAPPQGSLPTKTWTLHVGESFTDVINDPAIDLFYRSIETILHNGVTGGCGLGTTFCPQQNVLRQEMAPFLLKANLTSSYTPPDCTGIFQDVPCPATPEFPYSNFIEDLSTRGITGGCQAGPPALYCPGDPVTRAQMAPFLLKTLLGGSYTPPSCVGLFQDVPCPATPQFPFSDFIEDLSTRGITAGCQMGPPALYCPDQPVTREQMAAFLTLTFSLALYGP